MNTLGTSGPHIGSEENLRVCCAVPCYTIKSFNNFKLHVKALAKYDAAEVVVLLYGINL